MDNRCVFVWQQIQGYHELMKRTRQLPCLTHDLSRWSMIQGGFRGFWNPTHTHTPDSLFKIGYLFSKILSDQHHFHILKHLFILEIPHFELWSASGHNIAPIATLILLLLTIVKVLFVCWSFMPDRQLTPTPHQVGRMGVGFETLFQVLYEKHFFPLKFLLLTNRKVNWNLNSS